MNSRNTGHVRWRRGLLDHYADGRLGWFDTIVYNILLAQADFRSGAWCGNVWNVAPFLPHDISHKNIQERLQDCFARLEKGGYVFRQAVQGKKAYVLWLNKYEPSDGKALNGRASAACGKPVFFKPDEAPGDEPGEAPGDEPGDTPTDNPVSGAQVAPNGEVAGSNNSKTQELNNSRKNERKKVSPTLNSNAKVKTPSITSGTEPYQVLVHALLEAMGSDSLTTSQNKLEKKALELLAKPAGYSTDVLIPVMRAALAGELDQPQYKWSERIREADNPMAMLCSKIELLTARYGTLERRKQAIAATKPSLLQKPGVAEFMRFLNQAKKI